MITIQQIKAARSLLNWKQSDLAQASNVSVPAIAKIEMGHGNPRQTTLAALKTAFENSGIDFLGTHGVDQRQERFAIDVLYGKDAIIKIWDDIEHAFNDGRGGELLISNLDERPFFKLYGQRMKGVFERRAALNITTRALVKDKEDFFLMPLEWHRAVPAMIFGPLVYLLYADRMAVMDFIASPRFILIHNKSLVDTFRAQFEFNWSIGNKIDPKKATLWKF
jgi:transcriptional regulator with XRE-family HTH domain